jgi:hypothetical protein
MMGIFPDTLSITFCENNTKKPIINIAAKIKLFANNKNNYNFILPLSDERGNIAITQDWLREEVRKDQNLFVMDYLSSLDGCKSQIEISVLEVEALSRAVDAMYLYKDFTGINDAEITRYKNAQNAKYFPTCNIFKFNDNPKIHLIISLISKS